MRAISFQRPFIGRHRADGSQNMHRATRPLRGSVSCGNGWSVHVPCVSIQLTLSQNMLSRAAHMSKRAQRRRHPPSRRQARTRDRAASCDGWHPKPRHDRRPRVKAHCLHAYQPALPVKLSKMARKRAQQRWSGLFRRIAEHVRATLGDALWADFVAHANARYKDALLRAKCLPQADSSLRGPPARRCVPAKLPH